MRKPCSNRLRPTDRTNTDVITLVHPFRVSLGGPSSWTIDELRSVVQGFSMAESMTKSHPIIQRYLALACIRLIPSSLRTLISYAIIVN
ncbi:uncharacterized protein ARMOST_18458 [Armillaria ostoyae]|uniref:Uncharacterized protein n=1 Tax=Armillaria ostoyae TaxID=47428 RepID=A0A284S1T6_ARMOS|nr:uncharacterized protein ARMOST_18458 [Armillaria ostoyae]